MEEASLENVAAEKVSLSKIASGPCVRHRSFHRHLSRHLKVSTSINNSQDADITIGLNSSDS